MIKFSAGYTNLNNNFCIDNLIADKNEVSNEDLSVFSVVQNIINRGCPTKPSKFLQSKLGKINSFENLPWASLKQISLSPYGDPPFHEFHYSAKKGVSQQKNQHAGF